MKILLAVDGSEHSDEAARAIESRPWPPGTSVRVLSVVSSFVIPPPPGPAWSDGGGAEVSFREHMKLHAEILVQGVAERLRSRGLAVETEVRIGDPRSEIVDGARDWSADLIVLGSRGLSGIKRWLLGSVAQSVVNHAPCSVEVVHKKGAAKGV